MKAIIKSKPKTSRCTKPKQESGIAMIIALMMGMVLMAGTTGLLLRQLMARKLGAAESYQQMAESAAVNGFNRILSELNNNDNSQYLGYLLTLDHHGGDPNSPGTEVWGWNRSNQTVQPLKEICTSWQNTTAAAPNNGETSNPPHVDITDPAATQRDDGKSNIKLQYRLRGYYSPGAQGNGEGRFEVEGIAVREGDNSETGYLARTLLLRSLYVSSIVAGVGDWAVIAGENLQLGNTTITNEIDNSNQLDEIFFRNGKILLNVNSPDKYLSTTGCLSASLLDDINANASNINLENRVIPILNQGLPVTSLWNRGNTYDTNPTTGETRVWSFDDTDALACGESVCVRDSDQNQANPVPSLIQSNGTSQVIRLSQGDLCDNTGSDCHVFVEHINLTNTRLLFETSSDRPIVLHLEYPGTNTTKPLDPAVTGSINLDSNSQLCGVANNSNDCNGEPEQFILLSGAPTPSGVRGCMATPSTEQYVLAFEGNSLPHAIVHLLPGIVKTGPNSTELNGLIWSNSVCTSNGNFTLDTDTTGSSSVVKDTNDLWGWSENGFAGYGRMVTRGIRGTGLDTFRRW